jgi:hypothetical protein
MKISYKDVDEGLRYKVFGEDYYLGEVKMNIMTQKWSLHPNFKGFNSLHRVLLTKSYYSWREAGHTLYDMFYGSYGKEEFNPFISTDLYKM